MSYVHSIYALSSSGIYFLPPVPAIITQPMLLSNFTLMTTFPGHLDTFLHFCANICPGNDYFTVNTFFI